jgi:hypothetical protein
MLRSFPAFPRAFASPYQSCRATQEETAPILYLTGQRSSSSQRQAASLSRRANGMRSMPHCCRLAPRDESAFPGNCSTTGLTACGACLLLSRSASREPAEAGTPTTSWQLVSTGQRHAEHIVALRSGSCRHHRKYSTGQRHAEHIVAVSLRETKARLLDLLSLRAHGMRSMPATLQNRRRRST